MIRSAGNAQNFKNSDGSQWPSSGKGCGRLTRWPGGSAAARCTAPACAPRGLEPSARNRGPNDPQTTQKGVPTIHFIREGGGDPQTTQKGVHQPFSLGLYPIVGNVLAVRAYFLGGWLRFPWGLGFRVEWGVPLPTFWGWKSGFSRYIKRNNRQFCGGGRRIVQGGTSPGQHRTRMAWDTPER